MIISILFHSFNNGFHCLPINFANIFLVRHFLCSLNHVFTHQVFTSRLTYQEQKDQLAAQHLLAQQRVKQEQKDYLNIQLRRFRREQIIQRHMLEKTLQAEVKGEDVDIYCVWEGLRGTRRILFLQLLCLRTQKHTRFDTSNSLFLW